MREIQRFANLGHNLCENDKQTLHDYIIKSFINFYVTVFLNATKAFAISRRYMNLSWCTGYVQICAECGMS